MDYFYARVSTVAQNEARQLDAAKRVGINDENILVDKESGKDFNRPQWKKLVKKLKKGDVLFVKSLDRIGRNYREILEVWQHLTKKIEVDVVVLDMPLLDTRRCKDLIGTFISDVVLQLLSFIAENERNNIRERIAQGIEAAKKRGVVFGRKKNPIPEGFEQLARDYLNGRITGKDAARQAGMSHTTFRVAAKKLGVKNATCWNRKKGRRDPLPDGIEEVARQWLNGERSANDCAKQFKKSETWFITVAREFGPKTKTFRSERLITDEFRAVADLWFRREINTRTAARLAKLGHTTFLKNARSIYNAETMRPKYSKSFIEAAESWERREIPTIFAARQVFMTSSGFYNKARRYFNDRSRGELCEPFALSFDKNRN